MISLLLGKLLGNTEPDGVNGILRNATIAVPLMYLVNFWRPREMPIINCKFEVKLRWTKHYVLSAAVDADNDGGNSNNIIFTIKDTKLLSLSLLCQQKTTKNCQNLLAMDVEDQRIGKNIKQKVRTKIQQTSVDIFWNQTLYVLTDCLFCPIQIKTTMLKSIKPEGII